MDSILPIISREENRLNVFSLNMEDVLREEQNIRESISNEIKKLRQEKLESDSFSEKNRIESKIEELHAKASNFYFQDIKVLRSPYFGVLELDDDKLGKLSYKIGKNTIFGKNGRVEVIDWREAPISRLFYEYEKGEEYDEDIREVERSGVVTSKTKVLISKKILLSVSEDEVTVSKNEEGTWVEANDSGSIAIKEEKKNHQLPEIISLIDRDQFRAITDNPFKTFILKGGAGSGKTTVGLHRISYLAYHSPQHFRPQNIMVIMYNKALMQYIKGVLPELGVNGVKTETFHRFAKSACLASGFNRPYTARKQPEYITKLKKSSFIVYLIRSYTENLFIKSVTWLEQKLNIFENDDTRQFISRIKKTENISELTDLLRGNLPSGVNKEAKKILFKMLKRLENHEIDFLNLFSDNKLIQDTAAKNSFHIKESDLNLILSWHNPDYFRAGLDFSDAGIILYLIQLKGFFPVHMKPAHIMVDEAQDLSPVELACILESADDKKSVTICGDTAQRIKGNDFFEGDPDFATFLRKFHGKSLFSETLSIGYRATKEIMDLAWHVMGGKKEIKSARNGEPVHIQQTASGEETLFRAGIILSDFQRKRPDSLICVACRFKKDADIIYNHLREDSEIKNIRRQERGEFIFSPGIIVTNVHQIKGLEFSALLYMNPSEKQFSESIEDRMLLHVAFTRASEKLWILGHEKMAYGILDYRV